MRKTPDQAYSVGASLFATLARRVGHDKLVHAMSQFYQRNRCARVTTEALERFLHCTLPDAPDSPHPDVRFCFIASSTAEKAPRRAFQETIVASVAGWFRQSTAVGRGPSPS